MDFITSITYSFSSRQQTMQENREHYFELGRKDFPNLSQEDLPNTSYKYRAWSDGYNYEEGYRDYPEFKCVYRKGCPAYKAYEKGFNRFAAMPSWAI